MVTTPAAWFRLVAGLGIVFALFHWIAAALHSDRGQAGLVIAGLVVAAIVIVDVAWFGGRWPTALGAIGFGRPRARGVLTAAAVCAALLLAIPLFAAIADSSFSIASGWLGALPGLFAQAGIAEEALFRGWLFGHLRRGRAFWSAAWLSMVPFVAVHLLLFLTMPASIALAAVLLAVIVSFPLAHLYELGGATIWPPALVHFVIQGAVKVINTDGAAFPITWMLACGIVTQLSFLVKRADSEEGSR